MNSWEYLFVAWTNSIIALLIEFMKMTIQYVYSGIASLCIWIVFFNLMKATITQWYSKVNEDIFHNELRSFIYLLFGTS